MKRGIEGATFLAPEIKAGILCSERVARLDENDKMIVLVTHDEAIMAMILQIRMLSTILLRACQELGVLQVSVPALEPPGDTGESEAPGPREE